MIRREAPDQTEKEVKGHDMVEEGDSDMKKETLLKKMTPCGLVCHTCVAARGGVISELGNPRA